MGLATAKKNVPALGTNLRQLAVKKKEQNMFFVQLVLCPTIRLINLIEARYASYARLAVHSVIYVLKVKVIHWFICLNYVFQPVKKP